jgi:hypothetical protein
MVMLKLASIADLHRLIADEIQESLTLDYKASPALGKSSDAKNELCKDVSAFANSAGGQIVYGMIEKDRKPTAIDDGSELSREWIEQVIDSNVQPRIDGLVIAPIAVATGRHAYVVKIPQASGRAPHQAPDHKYYKRQNFQSVPMEDYEVKDVMQRASTPELDVALAFLNTGSATQARLFVRGERCDPIYVQFTVSNISTKPAEYAILTAYVDSLFAVVDPSVHFHFSSGVVECFDRGCHSFSVNLGLPNSPPLFREYPEIAASFGVEVAPIARDGRRLVLGCDIRTPGFVRRKLWVIRALNESLYLEDGVDQPLDNGIRAAV